MLRQQEVSGREFPKIPLRRCPKSGGSFAIGIPSPMTPRLLRKSRGAKFAARRIRRRVRDVWKCRIVQRNVKQMIGRHTRNIARRHGAVIDCFERLGAE
jgi:hypothetical protein